jgi:pilus assembly protein CpaB
LKRSNRLILLIGLLLAVAAFVGVILLTGSSGNSVTTTPAAPTTAKIVVATQNIPIGTKITADLVTTKEVAVADKPAGAPGDVAAVIGLAVRTPVTSGQMITPATFSATASLASITDSLDAGLSAISVQVDQISGVGTLVQPGDRVDVVLSLSDPTKIPIVVDGPKAAAATTGANFQPVNPLLNSTSIKVLVQNVLVVGTLLPPPPAQTGAQGGTAAPAPQETSTTTLNGQSQIVILALTSQQVELVRFTQLDGNLSLVLRSPKDKAAPAVKTTGITLRQLVDSYGVVPPKIILTTQP